MTVIYIYTFYKISQECEHKYRGSLSHTGTNTYTHTYFISHIVLAHFLSSGIKTVTSTGGYIYLPRCTYDVLRK